MAQRDAGQRRLARADHVPAGRDQVHCFAQAGDQNRAMRVVGQQRFSGHGPGAVHHPVIRSLLAGKPRRSDGGFIIPEDFRSNRVNIEARRNGQVHEWIGRREAFDVGDAETGDLLGAKDFPGGVDGHVQSRDARGHVFWCPQSRIVAGDAKFEWTFPGQRSNIGVDPVDEGRHNLAGVGRVAGPFLGPVAAVTNQPGDSIAPNGGRSQDFSEFARPGPPPQIELEQTIARRDPALGKEQIVGVFRVDVRDAPAVPQNLDRLARPEATRAESSTAAPVACEQFSS